MPLILPSQRVIRPNPLAYPAGAVPGIDASHPAAQNCSFSGVAKNGGGFGSVLSGVTGTNGGTPATSLHGPLGRITNYTGGSDNTAFPFVSPANVSVTLASIFKITSDPGNAAYILNTNALSATGIGWNLGGGAGNFAYTTGAGGTTNVGIPAVFDKPYFYAASFYGPAATNAIISWVIVRLDTGACFSGTTSTSDGAIAAGDGTIWVGNRGANTRQLSGGIATAMASTAFMSERQLRDWAKSPWDFWYPNKTINLSSSAASVGGGGFLAAWARWISNLPVIGTGNY